MNYKILLLLGLCFLVVAVMFFENITPVDDQEHNKLSSLQEMRNRGGLITLEEMELTRELLVGSRKSLEVNN